MHKEYKPRCTFLIASVQWFSQAIHPPGLSRRVLSKDLLHLQSSHTRLPPISTDKREIEPLVFTFHPTSFSHPAHHSLPPLPASKGISPPGTTSPLSHRLIHSRSQRLCRGFQIPLFKKGARLLQASESSVGSRENILNISEGLQFKMQVLVRDSQHGFVNGWPCLSNLIDFFKEVI